MTAKGERKGIIQKLSTFTLYLAYGVIGSFILVILFFVGRLTLDYLEHGSGLKYHNVDFFYNCEGEPYAGCGGQVGWVSGKVLTDFLAVFPPETNFYIDVNCFTDEGARLYYDVQAVLRHDGVEVFRSSDPQIKDFLVEEEGEYQAQCENERRKGDIDTFRFQFAS